MAGKSFFRSLRGRCSGYLASLILVFTIAIGTAVKALHDSLDLMESNMVEHVQELAPIHALERLVYRTEKNLYRYVSSPQPHAANEFLHLGDRVENALLTVSKAPFGHPAEREAVLETETEWRKGYALVRDVVATPSQRLAVESAPISDLQDTLGRMINSLEALRGVAQHELNQRHEEITTAVEHAHRVVLVALITSIILSILIGHSILNSVLIRLHRLEAGTRQLAAGALDARVDINGVDELGRVGETFNSMAEQLEYAYNRLQLQATRDGLTGLDNHGEFQRLLVEEMERARRYRHPLSLLMVDVDHFKRINDAYGHPCGDEVLRRLSQVLRHQGRPADHFARYGGEEFAVILPEVDHDGAVALAERLRAAVLEMMITCATGVRIPVTISIGIANCPRNASLPENLIKMADGALYLAKERGRNRCVSATTEGKTDVDVEYLGGFHGDGGPYCH